MSLVDVSFWSLPVCLFYPTLFHPMRKCVQWVVGFTVCCGCGSYRAHPVELTTYIPSQLEVSPLWWFHTPTDTCPQLCAWKAFNCCPSAVKLLLLTRSSSLYVHQRIFSSQLFRRCGFARLHACVPSVAMSGPTNLLTSVWVTKIISLSQWIYFSTILEIVFRTSL